MASENVYDVAILGSGPGGYVAAIRAGQLGLKTLVIEKDPHFGGTCLHVGCIPSKALLHTADLLDRIRQASEHGVVVEGFRLDWATMIKHKDKIVKKNAAGVAYLLRKNLVETLQGYGRLAGPGKIEVETSEGSRAVQAKHTIVATGSEPKSLPGLQIDGQSVVTNTEMLSLPAQPERIAVIGAGAVGVEFASMFHSFGTKVTLIEVLPVVLPVEDEEISRVLARSFQKRGIETLTGTRVESVSRIGDELEVHFTLPDGAKDMRSVNKLLVAVGRKPRTTGIGLETVGIEIDESKGGTIPVDGFMETKVKGVFAIGDVVATQQLAHVASAEGIHAVEKIAGNNVPELDHEHMPGATYCSPEVASVGLTEAKAKERGYEVRVGRFPFTASGKAKILGEVEGFVKIVSEAKYDELLGVHIIGPHATDLIAEAVVALELESTAEALMRAVHAHPTLSEAVMEAAHDAVGQAIHA